MNQKLAFEILGVKEGDDLKKAYRTKILQYHPDKNNSADSSRKFQEVRDAYAFLQKEMDSYIEDDMDPESYDDIMRAFLSKILEEEYAELAAPFLTKILNVVLKKITQYVELNGEYILLEYLRRINRTALNAVYSLFSKYREAFHLPEGLFERIGEILHQLEKCVVLNPTLEDMFAEENIYKLKYGEHTYLVPLWHHEMTFDHEGRDLVVKCFPTLPDNMEIDEWNVLTVDLKYNVAEVWNREVSANIGGREFTFDGRQLRLTEDEQKIVLENCGLLYNNIREVFNSEKRQNIVLNVRLSL